MAQDNKYGKVTTEFGSIGENEPVIVFRARDRLLPKVLRYYEELARREGSPEFHLDLVSDTRLRIEDWQYLHSDLVRVPTSSTFHQRIEEDEARTNREQGSNPARKRQRAFRTAQ